MTEIAPTSLIIDSRKLERLCMDGPALKVTMQLRSPMLFPLRRLSRIHIIGTPENGVNALLHCAEQYIPVAFFQANGRLRCRLLPPYSGNEPMGHWLEYVEFDPEARSIYMEWLLNQTLHAMASLGFHLGAREIRYKLVNEALHSACKKMMRKEDFKNALDWIDGLLQFHMEQIIENIGFGQNPRAKNRLIADIKPICELSLLYGLVGHLKQNGNFSVSAQSMTMFYQRRSDQLDYTVNRMLAQLVAKLEAIL